MNKDFRVLNSDINNNKSKIKVIIYFLINLAIVCICIKLYKNSLISCKLDNFSCLSFYLKNKIYIFSNILIFSITMFIIQCIHYFLKYYFLLFLNTCLIIILYSYDYHFTTHKHGYLSIFLSRLIFFILFLKVVFWTAIIKCCKKSKCKTFLFLLLIILITPLILFIKIKLDINKFNYGFNNKKLLNNGKLCKYEKINFNYYETLKYNNILLSYFESPYIETIEFLNNICNTCEYFSYPQPKDLPTTYLFYIDTYQKYSLINIKSYKNEKEVNEEKDREIFIKINRKENTGEVFYNPKININNFNYKQNIISKDKKEKYNVINIFIDALSRQQFFRIFPKTRSFIEKYYFENDEKDKIGYGYQFFRAHSIVPWTADNWWAYRYGTAVLSNNRYSLNDIYKKNGYETANFFNSCAYFENFTFLNLNKSKVYYYETPYYDHDSSALFCDPNFYMNDYYNPNIGQYSFFRKKLYGERPYDLNFKFSKIFMEKLNKLNKFKTNKVPFFQDIYFVDAHEYTQNVIQNMDDSFYNYFIYLKENGYLNNTIISIFSDHGNHMSNLSGTQSGLIEKSSPLLLILLDKKLNDKYGDNLKKNEQKLITLGDVHKSFYQLLENDNKSLEYYIDLFNKVVPDTRNCANANISRFYCYCK